MMDSYELSKIAGGVLAALLVIFIPRTFIDLVQSTHHEIKDGYALPIPAPAPADGAKADGKDAAPPAAAAFDPAAVVALLKDAKPENAAANFKKCAACHSAEKGAGNKAGPNLWGIVGRKKGGVADFGGYSDAMKNKGGEWTYADLAAFVHAPKGFVPGTKMVFQGIGDNAELADMVAYLRTLADSPAPLP